MIQITDFSFGYGKNYVLRNLNMAVKARSLNALIGLNGTGKSTLLPAYPSSTGSRVVRFSLTAGISVRIHIGNTRRPSALCPRFRQ